MLQERLISRDMLERRLDAPENIKADYASTDQEWTNLLNDILDEESGYVRRLLIAQGVDLSVFDNRTELLGTYPLVRTAMVRLCRQAIHNIEEDGLESESAADRSESYRPPSVIRAEVADLIGTIDPPDDGGDGDGGTRATLI